MTVIALVLSHKLCVGPPALKYASGDDRSDFPPLGSAPNRRGCFHQKLGLVQFGSLPQSALHEIDGLPFVHHHLYMTAGKSLGASQYKKCRLTGKGIAMLTMRRSHDHLIFDIWESPYPGKTVSTLRRGPDSANSMPLHTVVVVCEQ